MEKKASNQGLQQNLADSIQKFADFSVSTLKTSVENVTRNVTTLNKMVGDIGLTPFTLPFVKMTNSTDCCAPKHECPPHCIMELVRHAAPGEKIIIPFAVKNTCNIQKQYRVGARELKSQDGTMAPAQPVLNKKEVSLQPGETELVLLTLDLSNFSNGNTYNAEIVIREKEINQNICLTLVVDSNNDAPVAEPLDEKKYMLRWLSWQSHFYCGPE